MTEISETALATRVAKGAALLDICRPGWAAEVNIQSLQMHTCTCCILGQLYGNYDDGVSSLFPSKRPNVDVLMSCGFVLGGGRFDLDYPELTSLWAAQIRTRVGGIA